MGQKRTNKQYSTEYKEEAVALIRDQGYTVPKAAKSLGIASNIRYRWKDKIASNLGGKSLSTDEREELILLRKGNKNLRMEKEVLKKASVGMPHHLFAKEMNKIWLYQRRTDELSSYHSMSGDAGQYLSVLYLAQTTRKAD